MRLALVPSLVLMLAACATAPPPAVPTTPARVCDPPARSLKPGACSGSLEPSLIDCMSCEGERGCIDAKHNVYCVDNQGCDDPRCNAGTKREGRDDALLTR